MVDVPRRGFLGHQSRADRRDGLDMDAVELSIRHIGADVQSLALEAVAGADYIEE